MLKNSVTICCANNRSMITAILRWNSTETAQLSKRQAYYKKLGAHGVQMDDIKPEGWYEALPFDDIPGPRPIPILGNMWRFLPYIGNYHIPIVEFHRRLHEEFGNIVILKGILGVKDMVFIFTPGDMEKLFRNEGAWPIRYGLPSFTHYRTVTRKDVFKGTAGVLSLQGEEWFKFRSVVNPILMQPKSAQQYTSNMDKVASEFVENIKHFATLNEDGEMPEDFLNELYKWSLESIGIIALDKRIGCLRRDLEKNSEPQKHIDNVIEMFELMYKLDVLPSLWRWVNTPTWKRYVEVLDSITTITKKYVDESLEKVEGVSDNNPNRQMSALQLMAKTDREIAITMAMDLLIAGVDTTGRTLGAALYFLARHPDKQRKLRKEILQKLPHKDSPVTKEILEDCPYTKAVIKETTRIAPIAVGNLRTTIKDMVLCGYQIPRGTDVISSNLFAANSSEHVKDAEKFIPERWIRSIKDEYSHKNVNPFVVLPFGFGPRSCVGKRLANLELEVAILKIMRNFELSWPHEDMVFSAKLLYGISEPLRIHVKEVTV